MNQPSRATAHRTAEILLDIKAINLRPHEPYKLTAGWSSPCYIDCRKVISFPQQRREIISLLHQQLQSAVETPFDIIAGGETAGIPYAAWLSEAFDKPMTYIRKKPKGFGRNAQIEGAFQEGDNFLLAEDLATDGGSKITFVNAIREAGGQCNHTCVVFFYGVFPNSGAELKAMGVNLHYLTDWQAVLDVVESRGDFKDIDLNSVHDFLNDPVSWSGRHGGDTSPRTKESA